MNTNWYLTKCRRCKKDYEAHKLQFAIGSCKDCVNKEKRRR